MKRYKEIWAQDGMIEWWEDTSGHWVKHEDAAKIEAERDLWKRRFDWMNECICCVHPESNGDACEKYANSCKDCRLAYVTEHIK
jgi:hypothetical protein